MKESKALSSHWLHAHSTRMRVNESLLGQSSDCQSHTADFDRAMCLTFCPRQPREPQGDWYTGNCPGRKPSLGTSYGDAYCTAAP